MNSTITIRPLTEKDSKRMWRIRNHPLVRNQSNNSNAIPWKSHIHWFNNYLKNSGNACFVLVKNDKVAAYCRIDQINNHYAVSLAVDPKESWKGYGSMVLHHAIKQNKHKNIQAQIKKINVISRDFFIKNNFKIAKQDENYFYLQYKYD